MDFSGICIRILSDNLNEMLQAGYCGQGESEEAKLFPETYTQDAGKRTPSGSVRKITLSRWMRRRCLELGLLQDLRTEGNGAYGTRLTDSGAKGKLEGSSTAGGSSFVSDLSFGYSYAADHQGTGRARYFCENDSIAGVQMISQVRNNVEYELTDLDHYYEFYGGLAKAVENEKGEKPVMLVADTVGEAGAGTGSSGRQWKRGHRQPGCLNPAVDRGHDAA